MIFILPVLIEEVKIDKKAKAGTSLVPAFAFYPSFFFIPNRNGIPLLRIFN